MADTLPLHLEQPAQTAVAALTLGQRSPPAHLLVIADLATLAYETGLYLLALAGPILVLVHVRALSPLLLLAIAACGWLATAAIFLGGLIATKRLLVGAVPSGRFFVSSPRARRWIAADRLMKIAIRSPFRPLFTECAPFRHAFYRGMGARIHLSLMLGNGVKFPEPWALRIGRNVLIGDDAVVSGHKVERGVVTLATVEIGDDALIGARALILPGARIGSRAVIGASSVVTQGMQVPAGETWSGNPARRMALVSFAAPDPAPGEP